MRWLITGASGYLGRRLTELAQGHAQRLTAFAHRPERLRGGEPVQLDLTKDIASKLQALRPDVILHTAAINPGGSESLMEAVNVEGSRQLAEGADRLGARFVHVSTDVVHDGRHPPYADDASPSPLGTYAETKARAEKAVLEACPRAAIVRTSLIYGLDEIDHGTASFIKRIEAGEPVRLFADIWRQPVWIDTLAEALIHLAKSQHSGFFNVAGSQPMTRDTFGRRMLKFWNVDARNVETIRAAELGIPVPPDLRLSLDRARRDLELKCPGVDQVLENHSLT